MSDNKKLPKIKHNHTLTDILKASIFSLVMMAPITAIGITCAYVVCNKNAYQSYSGQNYVEYNEIENFNDIKINQRYNFNVRNGTYNDSSTKNTGMIKVENITDIESTDNYLSNMISNPNLAYFRFYWNTSAVSIYTFDNTQTQLDSRGIGVNAISFNFDILAFTSELEQNYTFLTKYELDSYYNLDNVFYYAVDTMQNNTLFSWTKTTAIYTPVNAMTTGMGINTPAIAVLLVYWLLCTAVYIIIDIVVKGFTWLTHLIGER